MMAYPVAVMVAAGESETVELRTTTGAHREAAMTVCAMVKHQGGRPASGPLGNWTWRIFALPSAHPQ